MRIIKSNKRWCVVERYPSSKNVIKSCCRSTQDLSQRDGKKEEGKSIIMLPFSLKKMQMEQSSLSEKRETRLSSVEFIFLFLLSFTAICIAQSAQNFKKKGYYHNPQIKVESIEGFSAFFWPNLYCLVLSVKA